MTHSWTSSLLSDLPRSTISCFLFFHFIYFLCILYLDLSACEWVSLCIPKTLWTSYLKNQKEFSPNFGHRCIMGSLICWLDFGVKRSKVKVTAGNNPKTLWTPYLNNQWREFHPILVTYISVRGCADYILGSKDQRSRSQQAMTRKPCEHLSLIHIWRCRRRG